MAAKLDVTMDASQVEAAYRKLQAENAKLRTALGGLGVAGEEAGRAIGGGFRAIQQAAAAARTAATGPADALRAEITKLDAALKQGLIGPQEYGRAIDQAGAKFGAAAGPVDQYALRIEALRAKLAAGQITQAQHDAGLAVARNAATQAADGAGRYQIALADLDRRLKAGELSQASYSAALGETRNRLLAQAEPVDRLKIRLAALNTQVDAGKLAASTYDAAIAKLAEDVDRLPAGVEKIQQQQALLDAQFQRGVIDQEAYRQATNRLQNEYMQSTTATQRLKSGLTQLHQDLSTGRLNVDQHAKAVAALEREFHAAAEPTEKYERALEQLTQQVNDGKLTAEQYTAAVDKQKQALNQATGAIDDTTAAGEKHGGLTESLGQKMLALGAGYLSFQAILGKVQEALAYVNAETDKAIGSADRMTDSNKRLAQVATSAEDLDQMIAQADKLASAYGEDRDVVRKVTFSARSEGFEQQLEKIIQYSDVVAAESQATVAGQVPNLFGGAITADQGINATLVAAERSRLSFEQIASALPKISEGAALQKASASETMGITSVMAGHFGSGDTAADRFKALATKLSIDESTRGKGVIGGVEELQRQEAQFTSGRATAEAEKQQQDAAKQRELASIRQQIEQAQSAAPALSAEAAARVAAAKAEMAKIDEDLAAPPSKADQDLTPAEQEAKRTKAIARKETLAAQVVDLQAAPGRERVAELEQILAGKEKEAAASDAEFRKQWSGDSPLKKFLGDSSELNVAFGLLVERMPDVKERISEIDAEMQTVSQGGKGALQRKYEQSYDASTETGRLNQAMEQRRRAKVGEEIANEQQFAEEGAKREAAIAAEKARQKREGYIGLAQYGGDVAGGSAVALGLDKQTAGRLTRAGTDYIGGQSTRGFLGRRLQSAATLGLTDVAAGLQGFFGGAEPRAAPPVQQPRAEPARSQTPSAAPVTDPAVLAELKRIADATSETRDAATKRPAIGASAAAALPSSQRLGR